MKRYFTLGGIFAVLLFALSFSAAYALSPYQIEPRLSIDDAGVKITVKSKFDLARVRLFWTIDEEPLKPRLEAFGHYDYFAYRKLPDKTHTFQLLFNPPKKKFHDTALPVNKLVRLRIDAIAKTKDTFTPLRSKEYRFKLVKGENGKLAFGLVFSDGPLVAFTSESRVKISWETNLAARGRVEFRRRDKKKTNIVEASGKSRRSVAVVENLQPDTEYIYQVRCIEQTSGDEFLSPIYHFRTAPKAGRPFRFAVMSDSRGEWRNPHPDSALNGVNVVVLNKLARAAYEKDAHFIVFVGDLISGYTRDISSIYLQYRTWKEAVAGVNAYIPIYEVVGNHDSSAPHAKRKPGKEDVFAEDIWRIVFTLPENGPTNHPALPTYLENVYSFNYAGCRFIILNSNYYDLKGATPQDRFARTIDEIQRDWLQLDLEENKNARFHFVFFHEPAYPCGGHLGSSLDHLPDVRDAVMSILDKYRVDAFYCGHEHNYSRLLVNKRVNPNLKGGVWQIITGGAGAPLYPQDMKIPWAKLVDEFASEYHWVLVEVGKRRASFTVYNDKGKVLDRFTTLRRKKLK